MIRMSYILKGTLAGMSAKKYLKEDAGYFSVGGFEVLCPINGSDVAVPFDWESQIDEVNEDDTITVTHGITTIFGGDAELDDCFEDTWNKLGISRNDLTARTLAGMKEILEFHIEYENEDDDDHLELVSLEFCDKNTTYKVPEDVLKATGNLLLL